MPCPGWPDVQCFGRTGRAFLEDVIARAQTSPDARARAAAAAAARIRDRSDSPLSCEDQCAKAYAAHAALQRDPPAWDLALSALEDPLGVPEAAASLSAAPTVVSAAPAASRQASPARRPRPRKRAKKKPMRKAAAGKRPAAKKGGARAAKKGGARAAKASKATRARGARRSKKPTTKPQGSRSRPRRRRKGR
jgi:hypothetical protein